MTLLNLTNERPDAKIQQIVNKTISTATKEWNLPYEEEYPTSGIGISELRPRHVGIDTDYWQATITTSWADWINKTVSQNAYLVVTGIFNLTLDPMTSQIFPSANGTDLPRIDLEQMYALPEARAFFSKPFGVSCSGNLTIQAIARQAGTERLGLTGYAIAKKAYLIAATPS